MVVAPPLLPIGTTPPPYAPPLVPPSTVPPLQPTPPPLEPSPPSPWTGPVGPPGPAGPQGDVGPVGPLGPVGPQGGQGVQGDQGVQGPPGGAPSWRGEWSAVTAYVANDAVSYQGSSYYAPSAVTVGVAPPAAPWQQIAAKGDTGTTGAQGPTGTTGPQGIQGTTGNTGSQGPQGIQGPAGPGVPTGGTTGQILNKTSATDFATAWTNVIVTQAMWDALVARVTALEARPVIDAVEDLKYGN